MVEVDMFAIETQGQIYSPEILTLSNVFHGQLTSKIRRRH